VSRFVETDEGDINLAAVATAIRSYRKTLAGETYAVLALLDARGKLLGEIGFADAIDLEAMTAPAVPAAAGAVAAVLHAMAADDSPDGCPSEVYVEQLPVCAWRVLPGRAIPVLPEETPASATILLLTPEGRWLEPGGSTFGTLVEAQVSVLERAQSEWRRRRENSEAKPR
jgi:hypothetical protein